MEAEEESTLRVVPIITILLLAGSAQAQGNILNVCQSGCDYTNIQAAVNKANPGDEIDISPGTYREAVHIDKSLYIYGATAYKFIWLAAVNHFPKSVMAALFKPTYIDGNLNNGNYLGSLFTIDPGAKVTIEAITIQNGRGTTASSGSTSTLGGGIYNKGTLLLRSCEIRNNAATTGGGIYNDGGDLSLEGGIITLNHASNGNGGGICNSGGRLKLNPYWRNAFVPIQATIAKNDAQNGGGIANVGGNLNANGCNIISNSAVHDGGGIFNEDQAIVTGCTISNSNAQWGGGIYNNHDLMNLTNSNINGNSAMFGGGGISNDGKGVLSVNGCTISNNEATGTTTSIANGGGIENFGTVTVKDGKINNNKATKGYGGGLCSETSGQVTFDGTVININNNQADLPSSLGSIWYQGYGVYMFSGKPVPQNGFDPAKQVTNNAYI